MTSRVAQDPRIDPRIKRAFADAEPPIMPDVASRDEIFAMLESSIGQAVAATPGHTELFETLAPSAGLVVTTRQVTSQPDGNPINLQIVTPGGEGPLACVYYIHGGGMMMGSCYDPHFAAWGRLLAAQGVAVVLVDFRNCLLPSSSSEVAPFPAGLNDCVSGLRWVAEHAAELGIDRDRIVVAGESGGGNLSVATVLKLRAEGESALVHGLYIMCPFLAGAANLEPGSSEVENAGILMQPRSNYSAVAYGIEELRSRNPLAWPAFATETDVSDFPKTVIVVNECDPLRDDGVAFYRLLLRAGVSARCRQTMGTVHATEVYLLLCPDISRDAARDLADFAQQA
jgi:acetyl esterase